LGTASISILNSITALQVSSGGKTTALIEIYESSRQFMKKMRGTAQQCSVWLFGRVQYQRQKLRRRITDNYFAADQSPAELTGNFPDDRL
jgi:hypothetical protein